MARLALRFGLGAAVVMPVMSVYSFAAVFGSGGGGGASVVPMAARRQGGVDYSLLGGRGFGSIKSFGREAAEFALQGKVPEVSHDGYEVATFAGDQTSPVGELSVRLERAAALACRWRVGEASIRGNRHRALLFPPSNVAPIRPRAPCVLPLGGCFWGTELHFQRQDGVIATCVGYTQGTMDAPTYGEVCTPFSSRRMSSPQDLSLAVLSSSLTPWSNVLSSRPVDRPCAGHWPTHPPGNSADPLPTVSAQSLVFLKVAPRRPPTVGAPPSPPSLLPTPPRPPPPPAISPNPLLFFQFHHQPPSTRPPSFPTPPQVCSGRSGHTEAVQLLFDPKRTSYRSLCDTLLSTIDPTVLNRVGADVGTQYRHGIYFHSRKQQKARPPVPAPARPAEPDLFFVSRIPDRTP